MICDLKHILDIFFLFQNRRHLLSVNMWRFPCKNLCGPLRPCGFFHFWPFAGHNACAEGYDGPKLKFRVAHTTPPGNHITLVLKNSRNWLRRKSDGKIKIQIFPNAVLGSDRVLMGRSPERQPGNGRKLHAQYGQLFAAVSGVRSSLYNKPQKTRKKALQGHGFRQTGGLFQKVANDIGLEPIMYAEYGYRNFVTHDKPISKVEDLAGLKMRTTDSPCGGRGRQGI